MNLYNKFHDFQAVGESEVLVAGDPERKNISEVEKNGGIHYHVNLIASLVRTTLLFLDM